MRQQELADAMRWDRTRLSHVLTRMEARGWIKRSERWERGNPVCLKKLAGQSSALSFQYSRNVKERFFDRLSQAQLDSLLEIREALAVHGNEPSHVHGQGLS